MQVFKSVDLNAMGQIMGRRPSFSEWLEVVKMAQDGVSVNHNGQNHYIRMMDCFSRQPIVWIPSLIIFTGVAHERGHQDL